MATGVDKKKTRKTKNKNKNTKNKTEKSADTITKLTFSGLPHEEHMRFQIVIKGGGGGKGKKR